MSQKHRLIMGIAVVGAVAASYFLGRHNSQSQTASKASRHVLYYVDPMHPAYKSSKPGIAPDCGMQLEAVYAEEAGSAPGVSAASSLPDGAVSIDSATQKMLGIRVAPAGKGIARRVVYAVGRVVPEDTRIYRLNSGVDGFIKETFNDSVGTKVKKDQKLATYYSPEFLSVASGFLAAVQGVPGAVGSDGNRTMPFPGAVSKQGSSSVQGYSDRLQNLGMSEAQIRQMAENHQLPHGIDIVSPADGFILARNITVGQHFEHDTEFYRVADLGRVWVVAEIDDQEAGYTHSGGAATVSLKGSGRELAAKIAESLPQSEIGGGTVKLRLELQNPGFILRPDMLVDVKLSVHQPSAVSVPVDALVDSGARSRVYVESSEGVFEPREVETGWRYGDHVEIRRGIHAGERVVVAATFLVDSESRLKSPAPRPVPEEPRATAKKVVDPGKSSSPNQTSELASKQAPGTGR